MVSDTLTRHIRGEARAAALRRYGDPDASAPRWTLDSAALQRRGAVSLADALRRLPGVNLRDYGGAGGLKTVSVRGLGAAHTTVLLDGLPMHDARSGQVDLSAFDLDRLSAIALTTGDDTPLLAPVAALGAAVVHLRSSPAARWVQAEVGSFGRLRAAARWASATARQRFGVAAAADYADNDYPFLLRNGERTRSAQRTHSRRTTAALEADLHHRFRNNGQLTARLSCTTQRQDLPGPVVLYAPPGTEEVREDRWTATLTYTADTCGWERQLLARHHYRYSHYADRSSRQPGGLLVQDYRHHDTFLSLGLARDIAPRLRLAYAADVTHAALRSNLNTDRAVQRLSLRQALSLRHAPPWGRLTLRFVHDLHRNCVDSTLVADASLAWQSGQVARDVRRLTPRLSAAFPFSIARGRLTLRFHAGETFRLPSFTESYYFHYGNTRLRPERARQWGSGLTFQTLPHPSGRLLVLTFDGYLHQVRDRIVSVPYNLFIWRTTNRGRVRALGLDLTLRVRRPLGTGHSIEFNTNASWQRVVDRSDATERSYNCQLPYTPPASGAAALAWEAPWCTATLSTTWATRRWATPDHVATTDLPPYAEVNLSLSRRTTFLRHPILLRLDLTNLTGHSYEVVRRYPMPGRAFRLSAQWRF